MFEQFIYGTIMRYPSPAGNEISTLDSLSIDSLQWSFYNSISSLIVIVVPFITNWFLKTFRKSRKKKFSLSHV